MSWVEDDVGLGNRTMNVQVKSSNGCPEPLLFYSLFHTVGTRRFHGC